MSWTLERYTWVWAILLVINSILLFWNVTALSHSFIWLGGSCNLDFQCWMLVCFYLWIRLRTMLYLPPKQSNYCYFTFLSLWFWNNFHWSVAKFLPIFHLTPSPWIKLYKGHSPAPIKSGLLDHSLLGPLVSMVQSVQVISRILDWAFLQRLLDLAYLKRMHVCKLKDKATQPYWFQYESNKLLIRRDISLHFSR